MNNTVRFTDNELGMEIATARIPEGFQTGGKIRKQRQSDRVPFTFNVHAIDPQRNIAIFAFSEEMFSDIRSDLVAKGMASVPTHIKEADRRFISIEDYLKSFAESVFANPLTPLAKTELPSINSLNKENSRSKMMHFYETFFNYETSAGMRTFANNTIYEGLLYRYEGIREGVPCTVLAGCDFKGVEYYSPDTALLEQMNFFGAARRAERTHSPVFGQGYPCDIIDWGSDARYILIVTKANEEEGIRAFIDFIASYRVDDALEKEYQDIRYRDLELSYQQSLQYQGMARQSQLDLQFQQQKLANMLRQNADSISAGLMDSWDKKMASDSRISQARSEAIRGVDTYTTSDGRKVEVSVVADHVYQDGHGDVYGVSGNAPDQDILTKLNWTELNK